MTTSSGRVARVDRGAVDVLTDTGIVRVEHTHDEQPVVGDDVTIDDGLLRIAPRRTEVVRASAGRDSAAQVLAANVDVVFVVTPMVPEPKAAMVERYLALAWDSGATPIVVLTKSDLHSNPARLAADVAESALGAEVLVVSAETGDGMERVRGYDDGRTLCMLGKSGAGKSTLANALIGEQRLATGEVRRDGKGRHTTTHRELVELPGGGYLIDTPGLRGVGLHLDGDGLAATFPEIEELVELCRFTDCQHRSEPGCAIQAALADGTIAQRRLGSWHKLRREAEWMAARTDHRLRVERRRAWQQEIARAGRPRP